MKCQNCEKPAAFHITELTGDDVLALHLCPECAKQYLEQQPEQQQSGPTPTLSGLLAQQLKLGQTAEGLAELDERECPVCGITFFEFRQTGRLGCPHDYVHFGDELERLLASIHGKVEHLGKHPKCASANIESQTELIRLRREMRKAVEAEDYELATELRDKIRQIEQEASP